MEETVVLPRAPRVLPLYARAVRGALGRGRGGGPVELPRTALVLPGVEVDPAHVAAYARVCGFPRAGALPPTYPHLLAFPVSLALMTGPGFPLPLLGLVHVANRIVTHRPVDPAERLTVVVRALGPRPHPRGTAFDVAAEVYAVRADEPVWESRSTYLRREPGKRAAGEPSPAGSPERAGQPSPAGRPGPAGPPGGAEPTGAVALWRVPAGTGRRYAAVSGDRNPIHLHPWAARPFGYRAAIAHGMWTAARSVAALGPRLPGAAEIDTAFHRPVPLPATVRFAVDPPLGPGPVDEARFAVADARTGRPHLTGVVRAR
ncbi:MaoC/PaaZ C-terminal domain-containing protein [Streptomyces capparidis]